MTSKAREDCIDVKKWVMSPKERVREEYQGPPPTQRAGDSLDSVSPSHRMSDASRSHRWPCSYSNLQRVSLSVGMLYDASSSTNTCTVNHRLVCQSICRYFGENIDMRNKDLVKSLCDEMCDASRFRNRYLEKVTDSLGTTGLQIPRKNGDAAC